MRSHHASVERELADVRVDAGACPSTGEALRTPRKSGPVAWLHLAATPTFTAMALLSATAPGPLMDMLCPPGQGPAIWSSMAAMYLLMGVFHSGAWVELIAELRRGSHVMRGRQKRGASLLPPTALLRELIAKV